jgi:hypothetical protein
LGCGCCGWSERKERLLHPPSPSSSRRRGPMPPKLNCLSQFKRDTGPACAGMTVFQVSSANKCPSRSPLFCSKRGRTRCTSMTFTYELPGGECGVCQRRRQGRGAEQGGYFWAAGVAGGVIFFRPLPTITSSSRRRGPIPLKLNCLSQFKRDMGPRLRGDDGF